MRVNRRRFLRAAVSAVAAAPFAPAYAQTGCFLPPGAKRFVVGAGLAGLVAAHRLRETGKRVIVIEARAVPGGRVRTVRSFDAGLYGELGAARIADTHEYALHWIGDLGLSLTAFQPAGEGTILSVNGMRARSDDEAARVRLAPNMTLEERKLSPAQLLLKYIGACRRIWRAPTSIRKRRNGRI